MEQRRGFVGRFSIGLVFLVRLLDSFHESQGEHQHAHRHDEGRPDQVEQPVVGDDCEGRGGHTQSGEGAERAADDRQVAVLARQADDQEDQAQRQRLDHPQDRPGGPQTGQGAEAQHQAGEADQEGRDEQPDDPHPQGHEEERQADGDDLQRPEVLPQAPLPGDAADEQDHARRQDRQAGDDHAGQAARLGEEEWGHDQQESRPDHEQRPEAEIADVHQTAGSDEQIPGQGERPERQQENADEE